MLTVTICGGLTAWNRRIGWLASLMLLVVAARSTGPAQADLDRNRDARREVDDGAIAGPAEKVLKVAVRNSLDAGEAGRLRRLVRSWLEKEPAVSFVVFELQVDNGTPEGCEELATYIFHELASLRTLAWVPEGKAAYSAGTVLALATNEIVMGPGAEIGKLETLSREWPREDANAKARSPLEDLLLTFAHERRYNTILVKAMLSRDHDDILEVKFRKGPRGAPNVLETKFYYRKDYQNLPLEEKVHEHGEAITVVPRGKTLVTLDASRAKAYGFAQAIVSGEGDDGMDALLQARGIFVGPENVIDVERGARKSSGGQRIVTFFNHPLVRFVLILGGCLGVLLEIKMLGSLVPGLLGLAFFLIFFVTSALPVEGSLEGTASLFEIALFAIGLGLLTVEFIMLPGVAVFGLAGGALCAVSLVLAMVPAETASAEDPMGIQDAIAVLVGGGGIGALVFLGLLMILPKTPFLNSGLVTHSAIDGVPTADSALEAQAYALTVTGKVGTVETGLRPAGRILLDDGTALDVVAQGEFIEKGARVVVTKCTATRIVVERAETTQQDGQSQQEPPR